MFYFHVFKYKSSLTITVFEILKRTIHVTRLCGEIKSEIELQTDWRKLEHYRKVIFFPKFKNSRLQKNLHFYALFRFYAMSPNRQITNISVLLDHYMKEVGLKKCTNPTSMGLLHHWPET